MIELLLVAAFFYWAGTAALTGSRSGRAPVGKSAGPRGRATAGRKGAAPAGRVKGVGQSWLIKAWNASGAPETKETTVKGATAVVGGKAAGRAARSGRRITTRAGQAGRRTFHRTVQRTRWGAKPKATQPSESSGDTPPGTAIPPDPDSVPYDTPKLEPPRFSSPKPAAPAEDTASTSTGKVIPMSTANGASAGTGTTSATSGFTTVPPPADWAQTINRINSFSPDSDRALMEFMQRETAGMLGYATSLVQLFETCVTGKGLDPAAMQGLAEYSAAAGEAGQAMTLAHRRFLTVYQEIIAAVQSGVQMPYDGRWFNKDAS